MLEKGIVASKRVGESKSALQRPRPYENIALQPVGHVVGTMTVVVAAQECSNFTSTLGPCSLDVRLCQGLVYVYV